MAHSIENEGVIESKKLKSGATAYYIRVEGRLRKIAETKPWKSGFEMKKINLKAYHADNENSYEIGEEPHFVAAWAQFLTGNEYLPAYK